MPKAHTRIIAYRRTGKAFTVGSMRNVILISLIVTVAALLIYVAYAGIPLLWYYVVLAVFAAFVVAYISMYGWDTFKELKDRFIK